MPERRTTELYTSIEPSINELAVEAATKEGLSISSYIRRLIVHDLIARGTLGEAELTRIVA